MKIIKSIFIAAGLLLLFTVCETAPTGDFLENNPPSTFLTVEKIDREGDFRLSSQISISWWGTDKDGFIVGYEYAINDTSEGAWNFTTKTDSTFILPIEEGQSESNVLFKIRAIDNDGAKDEKGARLVYPIVNSAPQVTLSTTELPADTMFAIASFGWTIDDPDGLGNISRTEIAVNDTSSGWISIPIPEGENRLFISLQFDNSMEGTTTADVFQGRSYSTLPGLNIPGIEVGSKNIFYVRTIDNAGANSVIDSTSWFVKQKKSNVLLLNDYSGSNSATVTAFHKNLLAQHGITPDEWIINDGETSLGKVSLSSAFPAVIDPTLKKTLAQWDHIYWISNDINRNITYALDITSEFFDNNGTMFVNIPMKGISQNDEVFNFLPVDSIGVLSGIQTNFLINGNTAISPGEGTGLNELSISQRIVGNFPLKPSAGSTLLYTTDFKATTLIGANQDYVGDEAIAIENAEGNTIYISVDMRNMDGSNNVADLINDLLINRLNFKQ